MCNFPQFLMPCMREGARGTFQANASLWPVKAIWGRTRFHCRKSDPAGTLGMILQHPQGTLLLNGEAAAENPPQSVHSLRGTLLVRPLRPTSMNSSRTLSANIGLNVPRRRSGQDGMTFPECHGCIRPAPPTSSNQRQGPRVFVQFGGTSIASRSAPGSFVVTGNMNKLVRPSLPTAIATTAVGRGLRPSSATSLMLTTPKIFVGPNVPLLGRRHCGTSSVWPVHAASSISRCSVGISSTA